MRESTTPDGEKEVKIAVLGVAIKTVLVADEATVADCLIAVGLSEDSTVKCDGETVSPTQVPDDGDRLVVASEVKGG